MARGKYKLKRERKMKQDISIQTLGLSVRVTNLLKRNEIQTLSELKRYSETDLRKLPGIGSVAFEEIRNVVHEN